MDIGERTEQITFRRIGRVQRSDGGYDTTPAAITGGSNIWADVKPVSARESEIAGRPAGQTTYLVTIDRDDMPSDLTTDDSIVWTTGGDIAMNIREIRRASLQRLSIEIVADAGVVEHGAP